MRELPTIAVLAGVGLGLYFLLEGQAQASARGDAGDPNAAGPAPNTSFNPGVNVDNASAFPVSQLSPSQQLLQWLKSWETLLLKKTDLGDGGFTIGWGHFEPTGSAAAAAMPDEISSDQADTMFLDDVQARAVNNVVRYVMVPQTQNEFDALVSLAYNLSPTAFSAIADQVNAGNGLDPVIYNYVRAGTQFETGLTRRRDAELAIYQNAVYGA